MGQQEPATGTKKFGQYLRQIREQRKISLDAVEEMTLGYPERVTKSHLSRIENGQAVPTFPRMFALSQIYGLPISSLAEKFETTLKQKMVPEEWVGLSVDELWSTGRDLAISGRFGDALLLYDSALEHLPADIADEDSETTRFQIALRIERAQCLSKLQRFGAAKEECECVLSRASLTVEHRAEALQLFAVACLRLGKTHIGMMALEHFETYLQNEAVPERYAADVALIRGNMLCALGRFGDAVAYFTSAQKKYVGLAKHFEACKARLNLASCLIELDKMSGASKVLTELVPEVERHGYDRLLALAFSNLAKLAFKRGDYDSAESYCFRSNAIARPREYYIALFRNCYYLWNIARQNQDETGIRINERSLRTYLGRIESSLDEADEFRAHLARGES